MPVPEKPEPGSNPDLFSNLRSFWGVLVAIFYTRLDLATTELKESGRHLAWLAVISLAALLVIVMTIFFLLFFLVVLFWDQRVVVLSAVLIVCVLTSVVLVLIARHMALASPKLLAQTLAELRRDVESLRPAPTESQTTEIKP
ncbi:MAG TPA: phage holin family protein [Candidatus Methylacidiphilales bacterium]|nr:phage holin family protein [Candidatus Methylacidiphilales bacterium]